MKIVIILLDKQTFYNTIQLATCFLQVSSCHVIIRQIFRKKILIESAKLRIKDRRIVSLVED